MRGVPMHDRCCRHVLHAYAIAPGSPVAQTVRKLSQVLQVEPSSRCPRLFLPTMLTVGGLQVATPQRVTRDATAIFEELGQAFEWDAKVVKYLVNVLG